MPEEKKISLPSISVPKGGGAINGKCEISKDIDCVWDLIYKKLKEKGQLDRLKEIKKPKDWSKSTEMRRKI